MRSPVQYFGGKGNLVKKLLPLVPRSYARYVEVFGGGASLLFELDPRGVEVYNDIAGPIVNLFRVIRDEGKFSRFHRFVSLTPHARDAWKEATEKYLTAEDEVERAAFYFIALRQSYGAKMKSPTWGYSIEKTHYQMAAATSAWLSSVQGLPAVALRLARVEIEQRDFRKVIAAHDGPDAFFYLDPPYHPDTWDGEVYDNELTREDHEELIGMLLSSVQAQVMLSGYDCELYRMLDDAGWRRMEVETVSHIAARQGGEGRGRVEVVWTNYGERNGTATLF